MHGFQGDVILVKIDSVPLGKKVEKKQRGFVLAEGEATGHAHCVLDEINLVEKDGTLYIGANEDFTITHEEHHQVTVPAGNYEVRIAKEYDHFAEEARNVAD